MIKRPKPVWLILILYSFSTTFTLLSLWAVLSGSIFIHPSKVSYFNSLSIFDNVFTVLVVLFNAGGAVTLFLLRRISVYLLIFALATSVFATVYQVLNTGLSNALGASGLIGMLLGYAINIVVCIYAFRLKNKGVLS